MSRSSHAGFEGSHVEAHPPLVCLKRGEELAVKRRHVGLEPLFGPLVVRTPDLDAAPAEHIFDRIVPPEENLGRGKSVRWNSNGRPASPRPRARDPHNEAPLFQIDVFERKAHSMGSGEDKGAVLRLFEPLERIRDIREHDPARETRYPHERWLAR